jgi:hypothetical protein
LNNKNLRKKPNRIEVVIVVVENVDQLFFYYQLKMINIAVKDSVGRKQELP